MRKNCLSLQCRGVNGKLAKDVGVAIFESDEYQCCDVAIYCPHYIRHQLRGESSEYRGGNCKVSISCKEPLRCLYDKIKF